VKVITISCSGTYIPHLRFYSLMHACIKLMYITGIGQISSELLNLKQLGEQREFPTCIRILSNTSWLLQKKTSVLKLLILC